MYEKLTEAAKHTVPDITSRKHHICMFDKGDDTVIHDLKNGEREKFKFMRRIPAKYDSCFILPVYKGYACYLCAVYFFI